MDKTCKIRLKFLNNTKRDEEYIFNALTTLAPEVLYRDIYLGPTQATITLHKPEDLPSLMTPNITAKLSEHDLELLPPPQYIPSLSIFASKVNKCITSKDPLDILNSINNDPVNTVKATKVVKIQHRN